MSEKAQTTSTQGNAVETSGERGAAMSEQGRGSSVTAVSASPVSETSLATPVPAGHTWGGLAHRVRGAVAFRNSAALYLFAFMVVVFALWVPDTFLTSGTFRSVLSDQAITCLVAVGLVFPIAAGILDLAVGAEVGLGAILVAWLLANQHFGIPAAIAVSLVAGAAIGVFSWLMITRARIPAFIATLGVGSVLTAVIAWVSGSQQIVNLPTGFTTLGTGQLFGITYPVYIMLIVSVLLWYVLERTPVGRRIYATGGNFGGIGGNAEAAALAGVRTSRIILFTLVTCGMVSGLAGLLETSKLSTGDPTIGPGYLFPVIAAVFLGSTQFRAGRFNIWGTVVAAYVLATGVKGLQLAGLPIWIPDLFNGLALLLAVGLAAWRRAPTTRREAIRRVLAANTPSARSHRRTRRAELHARVATMSAALAAEQATGAHPVPAQPAEPLSARLRRAIAFRNSAAVYLFVFMVVVFALWVPDTFLTSGTFRSVLSDQAITCLVAVGLVVPIAAGAIDLAVGAEVGLGAILVAWLLANQHFGIPVAIVMSLAAGAAVGVFSWLMITRARIPAFIATLGVSSVLTAVIAWVSGSQQIVNLPAGFTTLGTGQLFGITYPVYIMLAVSIGLWYLLERTALGRRIYATGGNPEAASLAGIRTSRIILFTLVTGGVVSGLAGLLETSKLSTGDPTIGPGYLLPVIAAVFLGSTQFRGGRMNIWGTVVAAYVLATGVKGLQLAGLPIWIPDLFNGVALLLAVGLAAWRRTPTTRRAALRRFLRWRPAVPAESRS